MIKKIILWAVVIFISSQIFMLSADNSQKSSGKSGKVTTVIVTLVKKIPAYSQVSEQKLGKLIEPIVRKVAHFSIYLVLALSVLELFLSYSVSFKKSVLYTAIYCLIYAASDEFHQLFVDGRSGQITDVAIDFCGSALGIFLRFLVHKIQKNINFS